MTAPDWRALGFLTPDMYEAQQEVWALQAVLRESLAETLEALATRAAEPTWAATIAEGAARCRAQAADLEMEAGEAARESVREDPLVRELADALGEVTSSGHSPSLLASGHAILGELGTLPLRLLEDVSGPHARLVSGRITAADEHRMLPKLLAISHPTPSDLEALRRLLRHLDALLFGIYQEWRQTFHVLGLDGESLAEEAVHTARAARQALGLACTPADLRVFKV